MKKQTCDVEQIFLIPSPKGRQISRILIRYVLDRCVRFLLLVQYSLLLLPVPSSLDQEQSSRGHEGETAHNGQSVRPADVVVLPVGHPVASVASGAENNDRNDTADSGQSQVATGCPQQQQKLVVMTGATGVQNGQEASDQQQSQTKREEELRGDEEVWQKYVVYDVIFLFEHPPASVESGVVEMTRILETVETHLPKTCERKLSFKYSVFLRPKFLSVFRYIIIVNIMRRIIKRDI